ncbi:MAG: hypothetical protein ACK5AZ_22920 [Bryobacteraceae bacterium]
MKAQQIALLPVVGTERVLEGAVAEDVHSGQLEGRVGLPLQAQFLVANQVAARIEFELLAAAIVLASEEAIRTWPWMRRRYINWA